MSFYRSDSVSSYKLFLPRQSAWQAMNRLGQERLVHIQPTSQPLMNRPYISHVRRCDQALNKIQQIETLLINKEIYEPKQDFPKEAYAQIYQSWRQHYHQSGAHPSSALNDVIEEVENDSKYLNGLTKREDELINKIHKYRDTLAVIYAGQIKYGKSFFRYPERRQQKFAVGEEGDNVRLNYLCGIVNKEEEYRFKRAAFLISKSNSLVSTVSYNEIFSELMQGEDQKVVFYLLYPGGRGSALDRKLMRLVDNYDTEHYELPASEEEFDRIIKDYHEHYQNTTGVLDLHEQFMKKTLRKLIEPSQNSNYFNRYEYLKLFLMKDREIYLNLNEMDVYHNVLQANVFVRDDDIPRLENVLHDLEEEHKIPGGQMLPTYRDDVPTFFTTNDYTISAHNIVQTYGVANYKEANPSFFTVITFPFMFGVMFGDILHGLFLFGLGLYMVFFKESLQNSMIKPLLQHRYLFTMMGFFAIFCGFIYNDFASVSLQLADSCYSVSGVNVGQPIPRNPDCIYPFGIDPVWNVSSNYLAFMNSLKMKLSVIIGVLHMLIGVLMKGTNAIYRSNFIDFFFEFIPQLLFMVLLFGYMDFLIVYKWLQDWGLYNSHAPSIITTLINLPMKMGQTTDCCGGQPMWGTYGDTSQDMIQLIFLGIAVLCIPIMLIPKPIYLIYCQNTPSRRVMAQEEGYQPIEQLRQDEQMRIIHEEEEHDSGEIVVHQLIQTIEYVLGCISNTASYLRLWALSLAHAELSEVFFEYMVQSGIISGLSGIPFQLVGFMFLAGITFGVLLCMDSLECFLHTLRLHWVQFQSKFYKGAGYSFVFFCFKQKINKGLQNS